jgi:HEPN domain-containing protein
MKEVAKDDIQRWIGEAERDLIDAGALLRHEAYYPLCRLVYLAVEKALQAWLLGMGQELPAQAGLTELSRHVASTEPAMEPLIRSLQPLEPFAPPPQRAGAQPSSPSPLLYSRESARHAIALARQAVIEVKRSLEMRLHPTIRRGR